MLFLIIELFLGLIVLLLSTEVFLKLTSKVSCYLKVSPLIVGATLVAVGTSLPEMSVSLLASIKGDPGLALGNVVGSNIVNIFLVFGLGVLLGGIQIGTAKTQRNAIFLFIVSIVFFLFHAFSKMSFIIGTFFILLGFLFTFQEYEWGIEGRKNEDKGFIPKKEKRFKKNDLLLLLFSIIGIVGGGFLTVLTVEKISIISGYSTTILGLSLTAIATSLPELLFTILGIRSGQQKIVTGNILGSNIYNILLIGGMSMLFPSIAKISFINWLLFLSSMLSLIIIIFIYKGRLVSRKIGFFLILLFIFYLYLLPRIS